MLRRHLIGDPSANVHFLKINNGSTITLIYIAIPYTLIFSYFSTMLDNHYQVSTSPDYKTFEFMSIGPKGDITKVVRYTEINVKGYFNLGFGDKDPITGYLNDLSVTNNGDSRRVLATVAATLYVFTDHYPGATVIATGSTQARTRLYRMGIANNIKAVEKDFIVLGLTDKNWENFEKNITYGAFLVRRKM